MKKRNLGNTDIKLTSIGFGGAPLGNLFEELKETDCFDIVKKSYEMNINLFDTSPLYGYGLSEHRIGNFLKTIDPNKYYISTKVGRYLTPERNYYKEGKFKGHINFIPHFDYSYDGVMRSFDQSIHRLAVPEIDICLIHDVDRYTFGNEVDHYFKIAMNGAYKALNDLKEQKVIKAIGVGLNDADICARFADEGDFDCMLLAGRYTLLDQTALDEFFPIAKKNNIGIILGGVFNSGILAKGIGDQITYRYDKIPIDIKEKYRSISKICLQYDVPVPAAALQFSYSNKLISSMILGIDRIEQIQQNLENLNYPIPKELWDNLIKENLLDERSMIDV